MKTSRICAGVVATLALFAAVTTPTPIRRRSRRHRRPQHVPDDLDQGRRPRPRPERHAAHRQEHGRRHSWTRSSRSTRAKRTPPTVLLGTAFTRSAATKNQNAANDSYMQGGFALATLTDTGVVPGAAVDLPALEGERTWMRPQIAFTPKYTRPHRRERGQRRQQQPAARPVHRGQDDRRARQDPEQHARREQHQADEPDPDRAQAGHQRSTTRTTSAARTRSRRSARTRSSSACSTTTRRRRPSASPSQDDGTVKMNWLKRFSNTAQHCRPQVVVAAGATDGFIASVEANNQPAEIGFRLTKFNVATGAVVASKIAVRSEPQKNKYVAEPVDRSRR